jgi:hypothetical protein
MRGSEQRTVERSIFEMISRDDVNVLRIVHGK